MPISVASPTKTPGLAAAIRELIRVTLAGEGRVPGTIDVRLTGDAELRALNRQWRGIDRATDVLSFAYDDRARRVSGDLVISLDRMRAQARRYRVTAGRELARLIVHGALHLAGHDHHRAGERRIMRGRERAALREGRGAIGRLESVSISETRAGSRETTRSRRRRAAGASRASSRPSARGPRARRG